MRLIVASIAAATLALQAAPVLAQSIASCLDTKDNYQAIKNCSELIRTNPKDAVAYRMRGDALARNGDLGQAIADYSKAIQLNPAYGPAYDSRATAYTNKGDYTRAVADATKSAELAKLGQETKAKAPPKAKQPKASSWASAKEPKDKQGASGFHPFEDRGSMQ